MQEFEISIHSFSALQDFVSLATVQPFEVMVGNECQQVSGKSFMGMLSLDYTRPILVSAQCDDSEFEQFHMAAQAFWPN